MNHDPNTVVAVVQSAYLELLELTEEVAEHNSPESKEAFRDEAEKTILMFIAAIVLASREYSSEAHSFLSLLVNSQDKPGGEARYLNEYATRWQNTHKVVPQFFAAAVHYDLIHDTNIARAMLCQIQLGLVPKKRTVKSDIWLSIDEFECGRGKEIKGAMQAFAIIERLDVVEDGGPSLLVGGEVTSVNQFQFEGAPD